MLWGLYKSVCRDPECNRQRVFTNYLAENECQIAINEELFVTISVQFWGFLNKVEEVDWSISPTSWTKLRTQVRLVPIISFISGEEVSTMLIALSMPHGVLPSMLVLLHWCRFMDVHLLLNAVSTKISYIIGIISVGCVNLIAAIPGFFFRDKTGMVWQSNNFVQIFRC